VKSKNFGIPILIATTTDFVGIGRGARVSKSRVAHETGIGTIRKFDGKMGIDSPC